MMERYENSEILAKVNMFKSKNLYPFFRAIEESEASTVTVNGQKQIMIGSNNYLGLTHHPYVIEKAQEAIKRFGTGCTGSRFLNGNLSIHEELEEKLAKYLGKEQALVFPTGMQSNLGTIPSLVGPKDCIFSDSENHASLIDACRLSNSKIYKFSHNKMEELSSLLTQHRSKYENAIIVADGVFSMTGDIINLPELVELAKKHQAIVYIDDAHGLGVLGPKGQGTLSHFGLTDHVDLVMGTFSKSFSSIGGVVAGSSKVIDYIKHTARSFIFSASMPPAAVATVSACIDLVSQDESILKNLWENVEYMRKGYEDIGVDTYHSHTPIVPLFIGDDLKAMQVTQFMTEFGIFTTPVLAPAVPPGEALIRTSYMASHKKDDLDQVLEVVKKAKKTFDLPSSH